MALTNTMEIMEKYRVFSDQSHLAQTSRHCSQVDQFGHVLLNLSFVLNCLQDLTRPDMVAYIDDKVGSHPRMKQLMETEPQEAHNFTSNIADKASGVFL